MSVISDTVSLWITKRDSFDLSCDGFESGGVQLWFEKPEKMKEPEWRFGWHRPGYEYISAHFFGTKFGFPFVDVVWKLICDSEIGERDLWGADKAHEHAASSPDHFSNWILELETKFALAEEPSMHTLPIWFTKTSDRRFVPEAAQIENTVLWFRKKPFLSLLIADEDPVFPTCRNALSVAEARSVPDELNASHWNQSGGTLNSNTDQFFKYLPNSYKALKRSTRQDFDDENPDTDWMAWCKPFYLHVEIIKP
ncbi:MAG: hypothetical protein WDN09_01280 [bacterium]